MSAHRIGTDKAPACSIVVQECKWQRGNGSSGTGYIGND